MDNMHFVHDPNGIGWGPRTQLSKCKHALRGVSAVIINGDTGSKSPLSSDSYSAGRAYHNSSIPFAVSRSSLSTQGLHEYAQETWAGALLNAAIRSSRRVTEF
jgi:hypothetical protein